MSDLGPEDERAGEMADVVFDEDERPVACEACDCSGAVSGHPCAACDGWGWREP